MTRFLRSSPLLVDRYCWTRRSYFTNGDKVQRDDPYFTLGLQYGDGCTLSEIKSAFYKKAAVLHPDTVTSKEEKKRNVQAFQEVLMAYQTLTKMHSNLPGLNGAKDEEEWKQAVWRNSDRIAVNRIDVAGVLKERPIPSPLLQRRQRYNIAIGHPQNSGQRVGGEYLGDSKPRQTSSVGRGQSKWLMDKRAKEPYQSWRWRDGKNEIRRSKTSKYLTTKLRQDNPISITDPTIRTL